MRPDREFPVGSAQHSPPKGAGMPPSGRINRLGWALVLGALCAVGIPGDAYSANLAPSASVSGPGAGNPFQTCPRPNHHPPDTSTYALCATAQCFYLNGVAYCKCDVMEGDSISATFEFKEGGKTQDVCDLLDEGVDNGFTVSTYSTPERSTKEYTANYKGQGPPPLALYTCPGGSTGSYAQCDGGVCFDSTTGNDFPGVGPVGDNEIICSCPITEPRKTLPGRETRLGYQISGPWQKKDGSGACGANGDPADCCSFNWFNQFCTPNQDLATGTILPVGAPTGSALALSKLLDGSVPNLNTCDFGRNRK